MPESADLWYKPRQLKKTACSSSGRSTLPGWLNVDLHLAATRFRGRRGQFQDKTSRSNVAHIRESRPDSGASAEVLGSAASERRGDNFKRFDDFYLKARSIIWPQLTYMCHIRSTAVGWKVWGLQGSFEAVHVLCRSSAKPVVRCGAMPLQRPSISKPRPPARQRPDRRGGGGGRLNEGDGWEKTVLRVPRLSYDCLTCASTVLRVPRLSYVCLDCLVCSTAA